MTYKIFGFLMIVLGMALSAMALDEYNKYDRIGSENYFMKITLSENQTVFTVYDSAGNESMTCRQDELKLRADTVFATGKPILCRDGFIFPDGPHSSDEIIKVKMQTGEAKNEIFFIGRGDSASGSFYATGRNEISLLRNVSIDSGQFIRGAVVSFWSDLEINGEVNGDVIAVNGNIDIGDDAVIRGNVLAIGGRVNHTEKSTVYGSIQNTSIRDKATSFRLWRLRRHDTPFNTIAKFYYNRIDGATPYLGFDYIFPDSNLPEIKIFAGYGFASERLRYYIGLKQFFLSKQNISLGGALYKELFSPDEWLIKERENTLFALLVTEDFKDYYEAEGGYINADFKFPLNLELELGYRIEEHKWLDAHSGLWSLTGGSKRFRSNFSTVEPAFRDQSIASFGSEKISSLIIRLTYNMDAGDSYPDFPFTMASADVELVPSDWNDSLDYTRILIEASRYQTLTRNTGFIFRGAYGNLSGGSIPMHKIFFLGGLGTLHGYGHKEYYGTEFWLADLEFRAAIPGSSWNAWLFYESGQIVESEAGNDTEVKNSLGLGITFNDLIRMNLSKRLDRSKDSFTLYVRLKHQF